MRSRDINSARLGSWLDQRFGDTAPTQVEAMRGAGSYEHFALRRGGESWVLRRAMPPESGVPAHDVLREFLILESIQDEPVRVPRTIVACDDPEVVGSSFFIMQFVEGLPIRDSLPKLYAADPCKHRGIILESINALAEIHQVDWELCGLYKLGNVEATLEQQISRWAAQFDSDRCRELAVFDEISNWLGKHLPRGQRPALVHGDYKLDNLLYSNRLPPRVVSVMNWDMAMIGDPLADLAWSMTFLPSSGNPLSLGAPGRPNGFSISHLPEIDEIVAHYAALTRSDLSEVTWYHVFARWKLATLLEGSYAKCLRGESSNLLHTFFGAIAELLLKQAAQLASQA